MPARTSHKPPTKKEIKEVIWQQAEALMKEGVPGKTPLLELPGVAGNQEMQAFIKEKTKKIIHELLKQCDTKKIGKNANYSPMLDLSQLVVDIFEELQKKLPVQQIKPVLGGMCRISIDATTEIMGKRTRIPIPEAVSEGLYRY